MTGCFFKIAFRKPLEHKAFFLINTTGINK